MCGVSVGDTSLVVPIFISTANDTTILKVIQALPGMPKPVTESEVNSLLQSKLNIQIATIDEEGYPIIHPTWFLYENDSGKLFTGTAILTKFIFLLTTRIIHTRE